MMGEKKQRESSLFSLKDRRHRRVVFCSSCDYRGLNKPLLSGAQQKEEKLWLHTAEKKNEIRCKEKKNSVLKVVKHWKGDQKGVGFLSLDPVKTQCDETLSKLIQIHICIYFHSEHHFGEVPDPQKVPSNLNHSTMNLTTAYI